MRILFHRSLTYLGRYCVRKKMPFTNYYKDFTNENKSFGIFAGTDSYRRTDSDSVLLVLDSSFNPPHLGHFTLIKNSVKYYQSRGIRDLHILLLLAVKNADKGSKPAAFEKRMEMMHLFSNYFADQETTDISLALTNHAKFVDKKSDIQDFIGEDNNRTKISFLVGFDTLVRIFDPKYYTPQLVSDALEEFMATVEFCCLARDDEKLTIEEQHRYVDDILSGSREPQIPKNWGRKIHFIEFDDGVKSISSSSIRQEATKGEQKDDNLLKKCLPTNLYEYITENPKLFQ